MKQLTLALFLLAVNLSAATYKVPVPPDLEAYSNFNVTSAQAKIVGDRLEVTYALPQALVGNGAPLTFTGKVGNSFIPVSGTSVKGYCMSFEDQPLTCMLRYPKSVIDVASRDIFLNGHFTGTDLFSMDRVARFFGNDPAGLLSVELK